MPLKPSPCRMTSNGEAGFSARPGTIRYIHPEQDPVFRTTEAVTTLAQLRNTRNTTVLMSCAQCLKDDKRDGVNLRKCAKCKSVWYCSKECQKANWREHKGQCRDVERGTTKMIQAFIANPFLLTYLEICLSLHFDLVNNPAPDTPYMARVYIGFEPSDVSVFVRLYAGWYGTAEPEKIQGMLQMNAVTPMPPGTALNHRHLAAWHQVRESLVSDDEFNPATTPVVIAHFMVNAEGPLAIMLPISSTALDMAKAKRPFENHSYMTGNSALPMTPSSCLTYINGSIRADERNQMLLRMEMREEDRAVIRAAGRGEDTAAARILKEKMEREKIHMVCS